MRLDRNISLALGGTLAKIGATKKNPFAILMYHAVADEDSSGMGRHPYYNTAVSPKRFEQHLAVLSEGPYEVVSLRQALADRPTGAGDRKRVVITFDDAFLSVVDVAFPLLRRFGFTATVYIPTAFIDSGRRLLPQRPHMSWADARRLAEAGITLGSHTVTHRNLRSMTLDEIDGELKQSRREINRRAGVDVVDFSCPFSFPEEDGKLVAGLVSRLADNGYRSAVTTRIGLADLEDDAFTLRRLPTNDGDDDKFFRAKLDGAYDWMATLQQVKKILFPVSTSERN
jgi:peptidoglycan/xylan/chitin deacetylase (PgdA/CDA1 family)